MKIAGCIESGKCKNTIITRVQSFMVKQVVFVDKGKRYTFDLLAERIGYKFGFVLTALTDLDVLITFS